MTPSADYDQATALVHEIGSLIVNSERYRNLPWDSLAVTAIVEGGSVQIAGFAYEDGTAPVPATPGSGALARKFKELCAAMQKPDGEKWVAALVQIRRKDQKIHMDFEYTNPARWKVTPQSIDTIAASLKP